MVYYEVEEKGVGKPLQIKKKERHEINEKLKIPQPARKFGLLEIKVSNNLKKITFINSKIYQASNLTGSTEFMQTNRAYHGSGNMKDFRYYIVHTIIKLPVIRGKHKKY